MDKKQPERKAEKAMARGRYTVSCPHCAAQLNPRKDHIILLARHAGVSALLVFSARPVGYRKHVPDNLQITAGERWEFQCPVCHFDLALTNDPATGMLHHVDGKGTFKRIYFSTIAGEEKTLIDSEQSTVIGLTEEQLLVALDRINEELWSHSAPKGPIVADTVETR